MSAKIEEIEEDIERLSPLMAEKDLECARIVACTPQMYMMRFHPNGCGKDKPELGADHIFVDEAGYCNVMNAMTLFANHVPITFLGDHKQLPPVCAVDSQDLHRFIDGHGRMEYEFLWSQSALFCESILTDGMEEIERAFSKVSDPHFTETVRCDLTESHRFGPNLAGILDRHVYMNGIEGAGGTPLEIICIDVTCGNREERENPPEADAADAFIKMDCPEDFAILTPYSRQIRVLKEKMPQYKDTRILTVHKSQGREWDTVILSVQDNANINREVPLRFTSSKTEVGMKVINTAVSRAKRRLVIVCDRTFWGSRKDELIGDLVSEDNCSTVYRYDEDRGLKKI